MLRELSVFFPVYNEEANIRQTVETAIPIIKKTAEKWEIIIVNDGSKDNSLAIINDLARLYRPYIKVINHPVNRGYGAAFKSGLYAARYGWIAFTDADGQFDFSEISVLISTQKQTGADLVIGYYLKRQVPIYRIFGSTLWQLAVLALFGLRVRDIDCGFKLINKVVPDTIPRLEAERGPFINSEFLIKAKKAGFKIVEVGVHHYPRRAGIATGAKLNVILSGLRDLFSLKKKLDNL
ncbi:glycosyltransferase family 2 protein [Patescibacteria group bacterium]|nr:glycosyltransferase family 2 protein [Patescibacteria group bacterium]